MKKRNFLVPVATLAAAVTNGQALADIPSTAESQAGNFNEIPSQTNVQNDGKMTVKVGQDAFSFVLKRNDKNELLASHSSHASHASHYSGS